MIVFHGAADSTVSAVNAERLIRGARQRGRVQPIIATGAELEAAGYTRRSTDARTGWWPRMDRSGAGHAWSGGNPVGSYADPQGPDASAEMVRFFLNHSAVAATV